MNVNALVDLTGRLLILGIAGGLLGLLKPRHFNVRWLLVAAFLVAFNDVLLTRAFRILPNVFVGSHWNWEGKLLALVGSLLVASLPTFGLRKVGVTLKQEP